MADGHGIRIEIPKDAYLKLVTLAAKAAGLPRGRVADVEVPGYVQELVLDHLAKSKVEPDGGASEHVWSSAR